MGEAPMPRRAVELSWQETWMIEPPLQPPARRKRRTLFAAIGVVAGFVLIGLELIRPGDTSTAERWFWFVVGVLLIGVGLAELRSPRGR